jgi:hypothetical protein
MVLPQMGRTAGLPCADCTRVRNRRGRGHVRDPVTRTPMSVQCSDAKACRFCDASRSFRFRAAAVHPPLLCQTLAANEESTHCETAEECRTMVTEGAAPRAKRTDDNCRAPQATLGYERWDIALAHMAAISQSSPRFASKNSRLTRQSPGAMFDQSRIGYGL